MPRSVFLFTIIIRVPISFYCIKLVFLLYFLYRYLLIISLFSLKKAVLLIFLSHIELFYSISYAHNDRKSPIFKLSLKVINNVVVMIYIKWKLRILNTRARALVLVGLKRMSLIAISFIASWIVMNNVWGSRCG